MIRRLPSTDAAMAAFAVVRHRSPQTKLEAPAGTSSILILWAILGSNQ